MKIIDNKNIVEYIESLIEVNNLNMSISDMLSEVVGNTTIFNSKEIEEMKKKFNTTSTSILKSLLFDYWELDEDNEEDNALFDQYICSCLEKCDPEKYLNNPYYKNIKIPNNLNGKYSLIMDKYQPYELFALKDMGYFENTYIEKNSFAFLKNHLTS